MFYLFSFLLFIMTIGVLFTGFDLVGGHIIKNGKFGMTGLRIAMDTFIFVFCVISYILACSGFFITYKRGTNPVCILIYGSLLFFLGFIPLVSQGDALMRFSRLNDYNLDIMCNLPPKELK